MVREARATDFEAAAAIVFQATDLERKLQRSAKQASVPDAEDDIAGSIVNAGGWVPLERGGGWEHPVDRLVRAATGRTGGAEGGDQEEGGAEVY